MSGEAGSAEAVSGGVTLPPDIRSIHGTLSGVDPLGGDAAGGVAGVRQRRKRSDAGVPRGPRVAGGAVSGGVPGAGSSVERIRVTVTDDDAGAASGGGRATRADGSAGSAGMTDYQRRQIRAVERSWEGLTNAARGKQCTERQSIQWVFDHVDVPIIDIDPQTVPGSGAVALLKWARADDVNRSEFFRQIWPKSMPTRAQVEKVQANPADENRGLKELIVKVQAAGQRALGGGAGAAGSGSGGLPAVAPPSVGAAVRVGGGGGAARVGDAAAAAVATGPTTSNGTPLLARASRPGVAGAAAPIGAPAPPPVMRREVPA